MRKLALNDEILLKVENPARYIGNEVNSVMKDKNVDVRFRRQSRDAKVIEKIQELTKK